MGDSENAVQATKKRAAGREISRDNPGLDDDEDSPELETGTFKRASDDVIATRRIVKVRRQPQTAPTSNPFAGIRLVPPSESTLTTLSKSEVTTEAQVVCEKTDLNDADEKAKPSEDEQGEKSEENDEAESAPVEQKSEEAKPEEEDKAGKEEEEKEKEDEDEDKTETNEKKDEETEKTPMSSFQQLSSGQNAFTNLSGTGFSTSTFSFGSIAGSGFGKTSGPMFGLKTDSPSFGLGLNGNSSLFGTSNSSSSSKPEGSTVPSMKEVEVETGEENEEIVFNADSILYEFTDGGWKERGKGEVKINVSKPEKDKARLVMRSKGNYRLILNANLFPDMKLTAMEKKGLSFTCMNSTGDAPGVFSTFALKFRDPSIVEEFRASVNVHKGNTANTAVLKTPENSPKASDE